jgi:mono/diheme cytochrome c family protein
MKMRWAFAALLASLAVAPYTAAMAIEGKPVYEEICQACHQPDGIGAPGVAPPLVSPLIERVAAQEKDYLALVVLNGLTGTISLADQGSLTGAMPPQRNLSDEEIAAVVNYLLRLNHQAPTFEAGHVAVLRNAQVSHNDLRRRRTELTK